MQLTPQLILEIKPNTLKVIELHNNYLHRTSSDRSQDSYFESEENTEEMFQRWGKILSEQDEVRNFFNSLSHELLIAIEAIMYAGRDDYRETVQKLEDESYDEDYEEEVVEYIPLQDKFDSVVSLVTDKISTTNHMLQKTPLSNYLLNGLKYYSIELDSSICA